jgi:riboflavin transporter FmnP
VKPLLALTALGEAVTGLVLLVYPPIVVQLLFDAEIAGVGVVMARIAGAALLAIGVACWLARNDTGRPAQLGLITGALIYDIAAAALLAYAGLFMDMAGIALWPGIVLHAGLAFWCLACIWHRLCAGRNGPTDPRKHAPHVA